MPSLRPSRRRRSSGGPRIVVLGDLVVDVVLRPDRSLEHGTDVSGRVFFTQGGSAATAARWLGRLGARSSLIAAVGRDAAGRALVEVLRADRVTARVVRVSGARTGRIGVLVTPDSERSFVTDRAAALQLRPADLKPAWFARADAVHLPIYSLLDEPLSRSGLRAIELGRAAGAAISLDLASIGPLLARGRRAARALLADVAPDILFATASEAEGLLGKYAVDGLLDVAAIAVVKRGAKGATILAREGDARLRFEVATTPIAATDTTGAGDAFDAGFLVGWFTSRAAGRSLPASLQSAALAGHRAAARQLTTARQELPIA
ncbi:MAG TPA: carbohydrate kinase family protein [Candidatus Limnocylindrales bacterium]|nr:carbohydrate kinase family protein [Candidatus Limnocylindrales bacterium]